MAFSSYRASSRLPGIDKVLHMFWCSERSRTMCSVVETTWHFRHMGSGSLLMRNEWVLNE